MTVVYVVVTGPPASGKSALSRHLAQALGLPRLVKDDIKQRLLDEHPAGTASRPDGTEWALPPDSP